MTSHTPSNRTLATTALATMALFPVLVLALHLIQQGHYHPLRQAISELALGRDGWLMNLAFCAAGTGMLCLATLHRRLVADSIAAPVLLALGSLLTFASAVFHADPTGQTTRHGQIHQTVGIVSFVCVIAAMFVSSRRFRRDPASRRLARPTLIWACLAVAAFFLIPALGNPLFGLAQRIFIATWLTWLLTTAAHARTLAAAPAAADQPQTATA